MLTAFDVKRLSVAALLLCGVVLALPSGLRTQTLPTLRIAATANDGYSEGYYAAEEGFFKKAGLNVEIQTFANGAMVSSAVAGGAADIGISNPVVLADAVAHHIPFTLIAAGALYTSKAPTTELCVAKDSPLRTAKDLEGKTIGVSALKDITQASAALWLAQNGVDPAKVRFVEIPVSEMGPAIGRGTIDAAVMFYPNLTVAKDAGLVRVFAHVFDVIAPQFLMGSWFATTDFAQNHLDTIKRFQAAIYESAQWANANHARSAVILGKYSKINADTIQKMTRTTYALSLAPQIVQPPLDLAFKSHILDKPISASDLIFRPSENSAVH
jgi:NitT/TauT family transport system substrate-binding protein